MFVLLALVLAACSDSTAPETQLNVAGAYTLQSINGQPLPFVLLDLAGFFRIHQVGGTLALNANRTFIERDSLRYFYNDSTGRPVQQDTTVVLDGTWELEDSAIVLITARDNSALFGIARSDRLILNYESVATDSIFQFVYRKN